MRKILTVGLCGLIAGFGGRVALQSVPSSGPVDPIFEDFSGQLPAASPAKARGEQVVLMVNGADVLSCEDLGRQVRELIRTQIEPAGLELTVWTYDDASGEVARFIEQERLRVGEVVPVLPAEVLGKTLTTPALVLVDAAGAYSGLSYLNRTSLVRTISFGDLLNVGAFFDGS